jgi:uncharacterized membrane protein YgdD (TMEM256/DUF423 family)
MLAQRFLFIASVFGALAVILGAFGAHGLEKTVDAKMLQRFHTGVEYQFYHTLALLVVGLLAQHSPQRYLYYAGYAFMAGILLFSGSLYLYVLSGVTAIAMITPIGGSAFIIGWVCLALAIQAKAD